MTSGFDAQRSHWVRSDARISPESLSKPGFELVWKSKFENAGRITPPALIDFYIGYRGFRTLGFFGTTNGSVVAIDTDLNRTEWEKSYVGGALPADTADCPAGMTSAVTRPTVIAYPPVPTGRGAGRGTPAKSGVGLPFEGAVTIRTVTTPRPAPVKPPVGGDAPSPFAPRVQYLVALSPDGKLHSHWVSNGHEPGPPVPFLPPNAHAQGLIVFNNTAYVTTTNNCGGAGTGVWALDLTTRQVKSWKSSAKSIAGTAGAAAGPDGTLYAAAGREIVALDPKHLEVIGTFKNDGGEFTSSPVVFDFKGRNLLAATTAHGRLKLLDAAALNGGKPLDTSGRFAGQDYHAGAIASWQDPSGTRWILAPANGGGHPEIKTGAIVAFKVIEKDGAPALEQAWISRDLVSPLPPIVVSGVVFALSAGKPGANARLYALDGVTGRELWNSGTAITSHAPAGGLAAGGTRVYVAAADGTQYAFGFPIEH
jgi:outer membrane protein assembly factor BamB